MSRRARACLALLPATGRRAPWGTIAGCVVLAVALSWLVASREAATTGQVLTALRWSAVILAGGVASVLDDPTEDDLAGAGLPLRHRRLLALVIVALPTAAGWTAALALVDRPLPWTGLSLEAGALVLLGVAVASSRPVRTASVPAGIAAAALPAVVLVVGGLLPTGWALVADPADVPAWRDAHGRWAVLAVAAAVVASAEARDPARRTAWRAVRPARPRATGTSRPSSAHPQPSTEPS